MNFKYFPAMAILAALALAGTSANAQGPRPGDTLPPMELQDLAQTGAKSVGDFAGRALLVEFFAYW